MINDPQRLGKVTRDDDKSRHIRKAAMAELSQARCAILGKSEVAR